MKTCYVCGIEKPFEAFSIDQSRKDGRVSRCKPCRRAHYDANRAQVAKQSKAHYLANKERHDTLSLAYYHANKDARSLKMAEWYESNKDQVCALQKEWRSNNPHVVAAKQARRRATLILATPDWADQTKIAGFYAEAARLTRETGEPYHVDHIAPLNGKIVCGLHCEFNLCVIPGEENIRKSNRYWPDMP